jgi:asparagine synthase (glutamine-hydrolysing)
MCGIAGLLHCGDPDTLARMTDAQRHRGPDDAGVEWFDATGSGLGHRRLSIIDLSPAGHQPMEDEGLWITFNGEIYNYRAVRAELEGLGERFRSQSDTEVILKAYRAWGVACLERFNGMFAFAIYDPARDELFAARDRLGIKPFYYQHEGPRFAFASEIKALQLSPLGPAGPDLVALHTPARFQISPRTGFAGVLKLPAGHWLAMREGRLIVQRYWGLRPAEAGEAEAAAAGRLEALLRDAVRLQMIADVPVGAFLSGGVDSSLVCALMRELTTAPIHSFTITFSPADQRFERMPDDSGHARHVAARLGLAHHENEVHPDVVDLLPRMTWHLDEPLADPAAINTYLLSRMARQQGIVVMLNGMGGDEVYAGYRKHLACLRAEVYQAVVPGALRRVLELAAGALPVATNRGGLRWLRWAKRFLSFASLSPLERYLASDLALGEESYELLMPGGPRYRDTHYYQAQRDAFAAAGDVSYLTRLCLNDTLFFLADHNLTYSDKAAMAAGVESRPPLIDHRLVEHLFTLGPELRIRRGVQKYLLKRVAERYLPREIVHRPKAPFGSPLRAWIRGALAEMVGDLLSGPSLRRRGLYDPARVARLIEADRRGQEDNAHVIWTLLSNEVWFRTFFDGAPAPGQAPGPTRERRRTVPAR